jgi:hypothetical protein
MSTPPEMYEPLVRHRRNPNVWMFKGFSGFLFGRTLKNEKLCEQKRKSSW